MSGSEYHAASREDYGGSSSSGSSYLPYNHRQVSTGGDMVKHEKVWGYVIGKNYIFLIVTDTH